MKLYHQKIYLKYDTKLLKLCGLWERACSIQSNECFTFIMAVFSQWLVHFIFTLKKTDNHSEYFNVPVGEQSGTDYWFNYNKHLLISESQKILRLFENRADHLCASHGHSNYTRMHKKSNYIRGIRS